MKLYLARHGEYQMENFGSLTAVGVKKLEQMNSLFAKNPIPVSAIFHSGILRAQQSAEIFTRAFQSAQAPKILNGLEPNNEIAALLDEIATWEDDVLLIGHLPFMGRLVSKLVIQNENLEIITFHPGTLVCLEKFHNHWWRINWVIYPELSC